MSSRKFNFKQLSHFSFEDGGSSLYRDEALKCQMEIHTKKNKHGEWGKGKRYFFIDGDEREFRTIEALNNALDKKLKE